MELVVVIEGRGEVNLTEEVGGCEWGEKVNENPNWKGREGRRRKGRELMKVNAK